MISFSFLRKHTIGLVLMGVVLTKVASVGLAQRPVDTLGLASGIQWAETITPQELKSHAYILASDSLQGRETGTPGQRMAAQYLEAEMQKLGLPRVGDNYSYAQQIAFEKSSWSRISVSVSGEEFRHLRDFYGYPALANETNRVINDVIFLGYGIDSENYSDYKNAGDLSGKVAVVLAGEPFNKKGISSVTGKADTSAWSTSLSLKQAAAERAGLSVLLVVESEIQREITKHRARIIDSSLKLADPKAMAADGNSKTSVLHISPKIFSALAGNKRKEVIKARKKMAKGRPGIVTLEEELSLDLEPSKFKLSGENVLGYIRGTDPQLADELVVISAHYDHLGSRGDVVFNGADDNASGTSTVLEIAEALVEAARSGQGTKRSVLILLVSGEEKGLLGSEYYAANPVFPIDKTIADINIDMIGRYDEAHADSSAYIYVIGAGRISPDLDSVTNAMNNAYSKYELDYTFDAEDDPNRFYYRSDHYNFAKNGVPSVFFFSGVHEDYHRPSDTPDKLDYEKMAVVGRHAFLIAWNLANRPGPLNRK